MIYYDDFVCDFNGSVNELFDFIGLVVQDDVYNWHELPHHDSVGKLIYNLKYKDEPVRKQTSFNKLPSDIEKFLMNLPHYKLWLGRAI